MKKRLISVLLAGVMITSFSGCVVEENKTDSAQSQSVKIEYNVNDYVTLGDYKGIEITLNGDYEYTDEGFDEYLSTCIANSNLFVPDDTQTVVAEDSIVNVDYVGSQDGVAFEGGSAEDQTLDIANNCAAGSGGGYISGFTSGLVGYSVGDEVAYEVTFPESYPNNEDLAGQTVIFTFNINYIAKQVETKDDLTDEIVSENYGYDTVDALVEELKNSYKSTLESNLESDKETAVLNTLINNNTVSEVPEDLLQARVDVELNIDNRQCQNQFNTSFKEYLESAGYNYDDILEQIRSSAEEDTKTRLILQAIAEAEGIEVDETGYNEFVNDYCSQYGYTDLETLYSDCTVTGYDGKRYFQFYYLTEKALDYCVDNAVVTIEPAEEVTESIED